MNLLFAVIVSIMSFGAVPNDTTVNNAAAINRAIEQCEANGGGTVNVPQGTFTTGTIRLRNNVVLHLDKGAVLRGSSRLEDYSHLETSADLSKYESGQGTVNYNSATDPIWSQAMVLGIGIHHAGINGEGCIDGADLRNPLGEEHMRGPHTVLLADCHDMLFEGFTVRRSANYAFLGYCLNDSRFNNITVLGGWDGIHLRGAKHVRIEQCHLHTGDDAIAGGYWEDMRILRCTLNSSCNGLRMIMPSVDVTVAHCNIYGPGLHEHITSHRTASEAGIQIEPGAWGKAPGRLDKLRITHCRMDNVLTPVCVTLGDDNSLGTITIDNIVARSVTRMASSVKSWGTARTERVVMKNCDMEFCGIDDASLPAWLEGRPTSEWPVFPSWGLYFRNVDNLSTKNVTLRLKGTDYRKHVIYDSVNKHKGNIKTVR